MRTVLVGLLVAFALPVHAQTNLFKPAQLEAKPMKAALDSVNAETLIAEWIKVTEIPAPSGKEQARAA